MKNTLKVQKLGVNTLKEEILSHSNTKLKKTYIFSSDLKESGYDIIEEFLIDLKARKFIAIGIDKKNTTRKILDNVLKYTKNVYVWNNNEEEEFNSNILVFEYEDEAYVYLLSCSLTESAIETDFTVYNKLEYDLIKDKQEYENFVDSLTKLVKDNFSKLTKEYTDELAESKQIFTTKQYLHNLPSISELLGKKEEEKEQVEEVKSPKVEIPKVKIDTASLDTFEIDLGELAIEPVVDIEYDEISSVEDVNEKYNDEEVQTEAFGLNEESLDFEDEEPYEISDEVIDMESLILDSKVVKLDKSKISKKEKGKTEEKSTNKKINLSKVSNVIMELSQKPTKGKDVNKIKVPNYVKDMIPEFFEIMEDAKIVTIEGKEYKEATINVEVVDVNNSNRFKDAKACIRQRVGQTYVEFESETLTDVLYEELDIARIIKLSKDSYHIEIIPKGIEEYSLWSKLCTNNFRGSNKKYGLM